MGRKRKKSGQRREDDPSNTKAKEKLNEEEDQNAGDDIAHSSNTTQNVAQERSGDGRERALQIDEPPRKKRKKSKKKKKKLESLEMVSDKGSTKTESPEEASASQPDFPYPTEADDHCESPREAYEHILPLLGHLEKKSPSSFLIYDPYYCDGAVKENLKDLGCPNVYNKKEDCYQVWRSGTSPTFSSLVTNPPYSSDHIEKLMNYVSSEAFGTRPWFLLMPNWVHKKDYFLNAVKNISPFYLVPRKRYVYLPPKGFREAKKSDIHKKSSPFVSMWYVWGGTKSQNEALIRCYLKASGRDGACDLARSKSALRDLRRKKR